MTVCTGKDTVGMGLDTMFGGATIEPAQPMEEATFVGWLEFKYEKLDWLMKAVDLQPKHSNSFIKSTRTQILCHDVH